jgi:multidrug efflux pump subunit AcrA (membrane-fusion protein)
VPVIKEVRDYEDFPGRIEAKNAVEVRARVTGYLKKYHFVEGADVKEGDLLFEIDPRPYKAELARAQGAVTQCEGRLKRLEADYGRASDLLRRNAMSREDFDRIIGDRTEATGNLEVAKASLEMAKLNLDWTQVRAPQSGKVSRRFMDPGNMVKADETPLTTIVSLDPIYAYFDLDERSTLKGQRLLREGKIKWSPTSPLPVFLGLADEDKACGTRVWLDPARMAERGLSIPAVLTCLCGSDDIRVIAGLGDRPTREGKEVEMTLMAPPRLAEPERLEKIALKTDSDGRVTRLKDVARVERAPSYPGYPRRGEIDFADNRVDPDTGTWRLRATFDNADRALYPGLYVRVRLPLGTPYQATLVSEQALSTDQGQKFVYVVNKAGKVDYRRVLLGRIHDGLRAVVAGLDKDDKVIVRGLQRVRPGMPVRYQLIAMPVLTDPTVEEKSETNPKSK